MIHSGDRITPTGGKGSLWEGAADLFVAVDAPVGRFLTPALEKGVVRADDEGLTGGEHGAILEPQFALDPGPGFSRPLYPPHGDQRRLGGRGLAIADL